MIGRTVKVKIFPYFEILNFRSDDVKFLRNAETAIFNKKRVKKENNFCLRLRTVRKLRLKNDNELQSCRERSELQLLCCYNSCKAVANNGEG